ncbi:grxC [Wigglesworthia glossinidia endosymbiont of Glossina brevipalpis]|uniref:Glutaredoxin n=1 Tax=Wigglesworthia glossinidia brevipalpis TaxID=36870 RepID=Q8D215_WIGBR|nr:grxC [Wigglesworthia glossinidia endosymbiont of Glossina brevipalpis]
MKNVEIYIKSTCSFCVKAKNLLKQNNIKFKEIFVENSTANLSKMIKRSKKTTVPQIFINKVHIGGYEDLIIFLKKNI